MTGVYRIPGSPQSWEEDLVALCLWGGPDAVASHRSAAALWELPGFPKGPLEITSLKKNQTGHDELSSTAMRRIPGSSRNEPAFPSPTRPVP